MLITLSRRTAICQSFAEVCLNGMAPLGAVSHRFRSSVATFLYLSNPVPQVPFSPIIPRIKCIQVVFLFAFSLLSSCEIPCHNFLSNRAFPIIGLLLL